jgi:hypothetical protein
MQEPQGLAILIGFIAVAIATVVIILVRKKK